MDLTSNKSVFRWMDLSLGETLLVVACLYFVVLKLVFSFGAGPIADEAYYWLWGRHPAIGYFDHPPLMGWVQGIIYLVFGRSELALRLPALVGLACAALIFHDVARRIGGDRARLVFLKSLSAYLASPLFGFYGSLVFVDSLLVIMVMGAGYFFVRYFSDVEAGAGRTRDLMIAAVLLGGAGLTKFTGAFLGLGVLAMVLSRRSLWPLLGRWPIYAAGAIAVGMQAPTLIYNAMHGFGTFTFHASERFDGAGFTGFNVGAMRATVLDTMGMLSPFIVPAIVSFFIRRQADGFQRVGKTLAIWTFWLSSALFLYIANFASVFWAWNIVAFVSVFPFIGRYFGAVTLGLHIAYGAVINTVMLLSYAVVPLTLFFGMGQVAESGSTHNWNDVATIVREAQKQHGASFIATNRYQTSSQLAFALDDPSIVELSPRRTAFDDWTDLEVKRGQTALIVTEERDDTTYWRTQFAHVETIGEYHVDKFGFRLNTYELHIGNGFLEVHE